MEWLNISLSILAIVVSIFAIIQTGLIANKSNNIALLSQRIEFYNKITNIIEIYSLPSMFKDMLNAKGSKSFFSHTPPAPAAFIFVLSFSFLSFPILSWDADRSQLCVNSASVFFIKEWINTSFFLWNIHKSFEYTIIHV